MQMLAVLTERQQGEPESQTQPASRWQALESHRPALHQCRPRCKITETSFLQLLSGDRIVTPSQSKVSNTIKSLCSQNAKPVYRISQHRSSHTVDSLTVPAMLLKDSVKITCHAFL